MTAILDKEGKRIGENSFQQVEIMQQWESFG